MKSLNRTELEILKIILKRNLMDYEDSLHLSKDVYPEHCGEYIEAIKDAKDGLEMIDKLLEVDEGIKICPSTKALSDYYGHSHNCDLRFGNQELCENCWRNSIEHFNNEKSIGVEIYD